MDVWSSNQVTLCGVAAGEAVFSHQNRERRFFTLPLAVSRLSGTVDLVNLTLPEELVPSRPHRGRRLRAEGELRSFNNRSGTGSRLVLSVFVRALAPGGTEEENLVLLAGSLCKPPNDRRTPMGREICDLMLAVNRRYGRSDYLPCIAWGRWAAQAREWPVGRPVRLRGRFQSRSYTKLENGVNREKTAYEVSVIEFLD